MAPNLSLLFAAFILLLVPKPLIAHSNHNKHSGLSFAFLKDLKECHKGQKVKGIHDLKRYLKKFGYLNYGSFKNSKLFAHENDDEFDELLESAVKLYQSNYHLKVTGSLDSDTIQEMSAPRCGVPDISNGTNSMFHRKLKPGHPPSNKIHKVSHFSFFPGRPRWPPSKTHLTYRFRSSVATNIGLQELSSACSQAFRRWQEVSQFTFAEAPQGASSDIEIGFHRGDHGDGFPFDGPGSTLAHAAAPTAGFFHYDADENWSSNPTGLTEVDLESLAVHEIGHLLGLGHSSVREAIMFSGFPGGIKRNLHPNDIEGLRVLYSN